MGLGLPEADAEPLGISDIISRSFSSIQLDCVDKKKRLDEREGGLTPADIASDLNISQASVIANEVRFKIIVVSDQYL